MKKTLYIAAIAALFTLSSCQKGEVANKDNYTGEDPVFTATIASNDTRTTISLATGIVTWDGYEEINITDAAGKTVEYKVSAVSKDRRTATITKKDTETKTLGAGPYIAKYGADPLKTVDYNYGMSSLQMIDTTETTTLEFKIACGVLEIRLKKAGTTITKIEVSNATDTYTLNCSNVGGVSIGDTAKFYIALPVGEYTKFVFTTSDGKTCVKQNNASGVKLLANQIRPITFTTMLFFPADAIHGLFSVDADGTKVCFAKGNLYYDGSAFKFEDNQYSFATQWNTNHVSHFFWSKNASETYCEDYNEEWEKSKSDVFFTNDPSDAKMPNSSFTVAGQTGIWRTLKGGHDEWEYLLRKREVNGDLGDGHAYQSATIRSDVSGGVSGLIIYPDNYTSQTGEKTYTSMEWSTMESAGCVFLPVTGYRSGGIWEVGNIGCYWASSAVCLFDSNADCLDLSYGDVIPEIDQTRNTGSSVRLVSDIQKAPDVTFDGGTIKDMTRDNDNVLDW